MYLGTSWSQTWGPRHLIYDHWLEEMDKHVHLTGSEINVWRQIASLEGFVIVYDEKKWYENSWKWKYQVIFIPASNGITARYRYNAVNFIHISHKRYPLARPLGQVMGCLLWGSNSHLYSASVIEVMFAISYYIRPRYIVTELTLQFKQLSR